MTLDEFMKTKAEDEVNYHIGVSSGFFFIGTKEEYEADIDAVSSFYIDSANEYKRVSETRLKNITKQGEPYLESLLKRYNEEREKLKFHISQKEKYINEFTPLRTREVLEVYDREAMNDGKVILISGTEAGKYWFKYEYDSGVVEVDEVADE